MKIDLHCHTIKTSVDSKIRDIDKINFIEALDRTDVRFVAITNHNKFDKKQFNDFKKNDKNIIVIPGIEITISQEKHKHGHLIIFTSPKKITKFEKCIEQIKFNKKDETTIDNVISSFKSIECFFMPHAGNKTNSLTDENIKKIRELQSKSNYLILEVPNLISSAILQDDRDECYINGTDNGIESGNKDETISDYQN